MSLDYAFWRYSDDGNYKHKDVYTKLTSGEQLDYVSKLPIEEIRERIAEAFDPIMRREDDGWENNDGAFMLETHDQFVIFACVYSINTDYINIMIDVMKQFACPLYDPQTETRYTL